MPGVGVLAGRLGQHQREVVARSLLRGDDQRVQVGCQPPLDQREVAHVPETRLWPSASCHRLASTVLTLFGEGAIAGLRPWARATPSPARSWGREWGAGPGGKMTFGDSPRPSPSAPRIGREVRKLFTFIYLDAPRFRRRTAR